MSGPVRFWFDVISPNAYLAWTQIHDLVARHGRDLEATPLMPSDHPTAENAQLMTEYDVQAQENCSICHR